METEHNDMINTCAMSDIDFEFVLDSSGSIQSENWATTTELIANHWIPLMQPNHSPECGNHIAIRRYASYHFYDLDFNAPSDWRLSGFTNYTEYVANVFENLVYTSGGTDTAGALQRVRTEDIQRTREGKTKIMVFTDGVSNSFNDTKKQAELLHPLVDDVFAFGIGQGRDSVLLSFFSGYR